MWSKELGGAAQHTCTVSTVMCFHILYILNAMGLKCEGNCDGGGAQYAVPMVMCSYILYLLQCHQSMSTR